ncbi:hypothetical protein CYMTET_21521 [Cymbomonas tetramitiformis]|uniref:Uncharacterized protein n=1 Tax=Cymbomonas tetramitiformis TaxID=36881 RepID=A0AAE0L2W0_9CHLO|nr:hypothetical protein CYMTET_21521 [Cymbomonas tetramitiformis]
MFQLKGLFTLIFAAFVLGVGISWIIAVDTPDYSFDPAKRLQPTPSARSLNSVTSLEDEIIGQGGEEHVSSSKIRNGKARRDAPNVDLRDAFGDHSPHEDFRDAEDVLKADAPLAEEAGSSDRPMTVAEMSKRRQALPICGNMPPAMLPNFTVQTGTRKGSAVTRAAKPGFVGVSTMWNRGGTIRTRTENGPRAKRVESTVKPQLHAGEQALVDCLINLAECGPEAQQAAANLLHVRKAATSAPLGVPRHTGRLRTCAIVGNSGGMLLKPYGDAIDSHDVVVRINVLENARYSANLGSKAHFRVLSYKMSKDVCCIMPRTKHPPDNPDLTYLLWFPTMRPQIAAELRKRYKNPVHLMTPDFLGSAVSGFKGMRTELVRLGFGPFEDWEFITSGMHAVLAFLRSCDSLNVYGFTTDVSAKPVFYGYMVPK